MVWLKVSHTTVTSGRVVNQGMKLQMELKGGDTPPYSMPDII